MILEDGTGRPYSCAAGPGTASPARLQGVHGGVTRDRGCPGIWGDPTSDRDVAQSLRMCRIRGVASPQARAHEPQRETSVQAVRYEYNLICDRHPDQLKLPLVLWTPDANRQLIWQRFQVRLSARSVRRYLQRWKCTPQKPRRAAYECDAAEAARWLREHYPEIRDRAKKEKALVFPITWGTSQRFGTNMRFLRRLVKQIHSPDLNPDEMFNHDFTASAVGRKWPRHQRRLMWTVRNHLEGCRRKADLVKRYFHADTVRYAA